MNPHPPKVTSDERSVKLELRGVWGTALTQLSTQLFSKDLEMLFVCVLVLN